MLLIIFICVLFLPIAIIMALNIIAVPFALTEKGNEFLNKLLATKPAKMLHSFLEWHFNFFYDSKTAKTFWFIIFLIIFIGLIYSRIKG